MQKLVNTGKYTEIKNNPMSSFGLIEENIELSHINLAVLYTLTLRIIVRSQRRMFTIWVSS